MLFVRFFFHFILLCGFLKLVLFKRLEGFILMVSKFVAMYVPVYKAYVNNTEFIHQSKKLIKHMSRIPFFILFFCIQYVLNEPPPVCTMWITILCSVVIPEILWL